MRNLLAILLCAIADVTARATTYHVGAGGNDGNTGLSYAQRFATVVKGVQTATSPGDIVQIDDAGVYNESLNNIFPSGSSFANLITLQTTNGLRATLRPSSGEFVIHFASAQTEYYKLANLIVDGTNTSNGPMKITSGSRYITATNCDFINSPDGQGVIMSTADGFRNSDLNQFYFCRFATNGILHYGGGTSNHGVYNRTDSNVFVNCTFNDNQDHGLQGSSQPSHTIISNCVAFRNPTGFGFYTGTNNLIVNSLCYSNVTGIRGGFQTSQLRVQNTTLWKNTRNMYIDPNIGGWVLIENCIFADSPSTGDPGGLWIDVSGQQVTNRNNLSYGNGVSNYRNDNGANTHTANNLYGNQYDAQFTDAANMDFTLTANSSARNAGITISTITTDFAGVSRPQESIYDIGAYEYSSGGQLPVVTVIAMDDTATELDTTTGTFTFTRTGSTSGALTINFTLTGSTAISGTDYTSIGTSVVIADGQSTATKTVTPIDDPDPEEDETVIVTLSADAAYTVGSPDTATVTIRDDDSQSPQGGALTQRNIPPRGQNAILF